MSDLDDVIDRLYGLPPSEFTAARNDAAREVGGEDAKRVRALKRPSAAAHAINRLVRDDRELVEALVDVADQLRQAQADGDGPAMRELATERRRRESAAVAAAGQVSASVRGEVEATLRAVVLDERAAEEVLAGRLTIGLDGSGFGAFSAGRSTPKQPERRPRRPDPRALERARRAAADAEQALRGAERERDEAAADLDAARAALVHAEERDGTAEAALAAARVEADAAGLALRDAEREHSTDS